MDKAIKKKKEMDEYGNMDMSAFLRLEEAAERYRKPKRKIYLWETDKKLDEERMREEAANMQTQEDDEPFYFYETDRRLAEEERKYREEQAKADKKEKTSTKIINNMIDKEFDYLYETDRILAEEANVSIG